MKIKYKLLIFTMFLSAIFYIEKPVESQANVLGTATTAEAETIVNKDNVSIKTTTAFDQKEIEDYETIDFPIEYKDDNDLEYGTEEILQEGTKGKKTYKYLLTYWADEEIDRQLVNTIVDEPVKQVVAKGTKIVWRQLPGGYGDYKYWYKLHVWATKYDGNCDGCRGLTYSGTPVRKGVCAVDPKVIKLGTNFYVAGYGMCRSEDIGGAIKGNRVDLGYEDVMKGEWRTGWTDVYLLTNSPEGDGDFYK